MTEIKISKTDDTIIIFGTDRDLLDIFIDNLFHDNIENKRYIVTEIDYENEPEWKVIIKKNI